jgi:hypothetical protein
LHTIFLLRQLIKSKLDKQASKYFENDVVICPLLEGKSYSFEDPAE